MSSLTLFHDCSHFVLELFNVDKASLQQLAKQEEVDEIFNYFAELIQDVTPSDTDPVIDEQPTLSIPFAERVDNADPGMEAEARVPPEELATDLGFHSNLPLLFNRYRHSAGLTAWDPKYTQLFRDQESGKLSSDLLPLILHWHQIAGVHAIIQKLFSSKPEPAYCPGILLADEVGLGKTFQAGTLVAFLSDLVLRQERNLTLPPLIGKIPFSYHPHRSQSDAS